MEAAHPTLTALVSVNGSRQKDVSTYILNPLSYQDYSTRPRVEY